MVFVFLALVAFLDFYNYDNVYTYLIDFRENQNNTIEIEDDFICVKGINSYLHITYVYPD